jgi:hypothetical protein
MDAADLAQAQGLSPLHSPLLTSHNSPYVHVSLVIIDINANIQRETYPPSANTGAHAARCLYPSPSPSPFPCPTVISPQPTIFRSFPTPFLLPLFPSLFVSFIIAFFLQIHIIEHCPPFINPSRPPSPSPLSLWDTPPLAPHIIIDVIYSGGDIAHASNTGVIDGLLAGQAYSIQFEILQCDLGGSSERVTGVTLDGVELGACNPTGGDYDCTFYTCPLDSKSSVFTATASTVDVDVRLSGHSWDCDCDTTTWECSEQGKIGGRTPVTMAARFTLIKGMLWS